MFIFEQNQENWKENLLSKQILSNHQNSDWRKYEL